MSQLLQLTRIAQKNWRETGIKQRIETLRSIRAALVDHAPQLAQRCAEVRHRPTAEIMASEVLPLVEACRFLERNAGRILRPRRVRGSRFFSNPLHVSAEIHREPFGVILIIAPSNYPLFLGGVQTLQALVAGNGVILKPGAGAAALLQQFAQVLSMGGLPPSLLQILTEDTDAARQCMDHRVDKVILTGSASTGRKVLEQLAPHLTPATMELSGCDAAFVRRDADLTLTAQALVFGACLNHGATCIAPKRIFASREIATELEGRLAQLLAEQKPIPLALPLAAELTALWQDASSQGAHLLAGRFHEDGRVSGPLLLAGLPQGHRLRKEDFFAPIMSLTVVADDEEALAMSGECPYALGATVFSRDVAGARSLACRINAGVVVINDMIAPTADARLPFGGSGESGFGSTRGEEGLLELTHPKVVTRSPGQRRWHFQPSVPGDEQLFQQALTWKHGHTFQARWGAFIKLIGLIFKRGKIEATKHTKGDS